jgi:hypothetical protein
MKKILIWLLVIVIVFGIGTFAFYELYLPTLIAKSLSEDKPVSDLIPENQRAQIEQLKKPLNKNVANIIAKIHKSNIPVEMLVSAVENVSQQDVDNLAEEIQNNPTITPNDLNVLIQQRFAPGIDLASLEQITSGIKPQDLQRAVKKYQSYREKQPFDFKLAKSVIIKMIEEKEQQYQQQKK